MDIIGPAGFVTELIAKIAASRSNRPRLGVRIIGVRYDVSQKRLVFRAEVLNYGHLAAMHCEPFWSVFSPTADEISSGMGVFWSPAADDDYDFVNRDARSLTIDYNIRRFCWAELDVSSAPVEGFDVYTFPYEHPAGIYPFAVIVEYGRYKSFDLIGIEIKEQITRSVPESEAIEALGMRWRYGRRWGMRPGFRKIRTFISRTDYHNYVRAT